MLQVAPARERAAIIRDLVSVVCPTVVFGHSYKVCVSTCISQLPSSREQIVGDLPPHGFTWRDIFSEGLPNIVRWWLHLPNYAGV